MAGSVSVVLLRPLVAALPPDRAGRVLSASGLSADQLAQPEERVTAAQFCVAWSEATRGERTLALRLADAAPPGLFGIIEYVCRCAPNLRSALSLWSRYLGLLDDAVRVALVAVPGGAALRVVEESEAPAPASHELCFALVLRHARGLVTPLEATARFAHRVEDPTPFFAWFGKVEFGAPHTELAFSDAALDAPLLTADPDLHALLLVDAETRLAPARIAGRVRRALVAGFASERADLEGVARQLGMTGRSLQRRLKDEGSSFQSVREEARRELAERFLKQGMSFAEIAFLLGFSEPSAFFRAFRRWTGVTPGERRVALGG